MTRIEWNSPAQNSRTCGQNLWGPIGIKTLPLSKQARTHTQRQLTDITVHPTQEKETRHTHFLPLCPLNDAIHPILSHPILLYLIISFLSTSLPVSLSVCLFVWCLSYASNKLSDLRKVPATMPSSIPHSSVPFLMRKYPFIPQSGFQLFATNQ